MTYNVEGVKNFDVIHTAIADHDPDIVCLQELMMRSQNLAYDFLRHFPQYEWITKLADQQVDIEKALTQKTLSYHGTALGINKSIQRD